MGHRSNVLVEFPEKCWKQFDWLAEVLLSATNWMEAVVQFARLISVRLAKRHTPNGLQTGSAHETEYCPFRAVAPSPANVLSLLGLRVEPLIKLFERRQKFNSLDGSQ